MNFLPFALAALAAMAVAACSDESSQPVSATTGPNPTLAIPKSQFIPTVHIAPVAGWPEGG